ncbi:MAG: histidine phosphatase family protein [Pseudomonadota bacterium]
MAALSVPHPLYLLRHGETDWNRVHRFQGKSDIPINKVGEEQARAHGELLSHLTGVGKSNYKLRLISSPLQRCRQTADIIASILGLSNENIVTDKRITEVGFGRWEGLTSAEIKDRFYDERQGRKRDPWHICPQGGESLADREEDVRAFLADTKPSDIVVSHGGILRIVLHLLGNKDKQSASRAEISQSGLLFWDGKTLMETGDQ